jgi:hypothetical protein
MVFGEDYPMIETTQLGQHDNFIVGMMGEGTLNHPSQLDMALSSVRHATKQYIRRKTHFKSNRFQLMYS